MITKTSLLENGGIRNETLHQVRVCVPALGPGRRCWGMEARDDERLERCAHCINRSFSGSREAGSWLRHTTSCRYEYIEHRQGEGKVHGSHRQ